MYVYMQGLGKHMVKGKEIWGPGDIEGTPSSPSPPSPSYTHKATWDLTDATTFSTCTLPPSLPPSLLPPPSLPLYMCSARLYPPEAPPKERKERMKEPRAVFYKMLRPELVHTYFVRTLLLLLFFFFLTLCIYICCAELQLNFGEQLVSDVYTGSFLLFSPFTHTRTHTHTHIHTYTYPTPIYIQDGT